MNEAAIGVQAETRNTPSTVGLVSQRLYDEWPGGFAGVLGLDTLRLRNLRLHASPAAGPLPLPAQDPLD
jgi:hypothetical protein